jgi:hypothetical protein
MQRIAAAVALSPVNLLHRMKQGAGRKQVPARLLALAQALLVNCAPSGRERMRLPLAAKIAFMTAGATGGTPGSPTPPMCMS